MTSFEWVLPRAATQGSLGDPDQSRPDDRHRSHKGCLYAEIVRRPWTIVMVALALLCPAVTAWTATAQVRTPGGSSPTITGASARGTLELRVRGATAPAPAFRVVIKGIKGAAKRHSRIRTVIAGSGTVTGLQRGRYRLRLPSLAGDDGRVFIPKKKSRSKVFRITGKRKVVRASLRVVEHRESRTLAGRVIDEQGRAVAGLRICAEYGIAPDQSPIRRCGARTAANGSYSMSYGKADLSMGATGYDTWSWPLQLTAGDPYTDSPWQTTVIESASTVVGQRGFITGRVTGPDGDGLSGVKICGAPRPSYHPGLSAVGGDVCDTSADSGQYSLRVDGTTDLYVTSSNADLVLQSLFGSKLDWLSTNTEPWVAGGQTSEPSLFGDFGAGKQLAGEDLPAGAVADFEVIPLEQASPITLTGGTGISGLTVCAASLDDVGCSVTDETGTYVIALPVRSSAEMRTVPSPVSVSYATDDTVVGAARPAAGLPGQTLTLNLAPDRWSQ